MSAKKDYKALADAIAKAAGGASNVSSASHCMTRLRLNLKDGTKLDSEAAKAIPHVLNLVVQNGEYQFVIGQDVASLYEEFIKIDGIHAAGMVDENLDATVASKEARSVKDIVNACLSFIGGTFSPVIPVLVAGGLTGAVLTLLTTFAGVSTDSGTYQVFYFLNQATFYFLPIFIGFSAASRLKSNGFLGAFLAAGLLYFTANVSALEDAPLLSFVGLPIQNITYNSSVFPIILGVLFMSVVYKFLQKSLPVVMRTIFVPLITMLITFPVTLLLLGPIGQIVGTWLSDGVFALYQVAPPVAVALIGLGTPWLVFFGMNNATYPIIFALMAQVNADPLICTGMAPSNVAVGGACLAAALIAKNLEDKSVATSAGLTALCGITEPGVYGVLFTKRYPLIGAMIGGGIGGLLAGFLGMKQYVISTPGFISFASYISPDGSMYNVSVSLLVMALAVAIAFVATYLLGKRVK